MDTDELQESIIRILLEHKYMYPSEARDLSNKIMFNIREYIASNNLQKSF